MIKNIIENFHKYRLAGEHGKAMKAIKPLKARYSFKEEQVVTTLVTDDFLQQDCLAYLRLHSDKA